MKEKRIDELCGTKANKRNEISLDCLPRRAASPTTNQQSNQLLSLSEAIDGVDWWSCAIHELSFLLSFLELVGYGRWHRQWLRQEEKTKTKRKGRNEWSRSKEEWMEQQTKLERPFNQMKVYFCLSWRKRIEFGCGMGPRGAKRAAECLWRKHWVERISMKWWSSYGGPAGPRQPINPSFNPFNSITNQKSLILISLNWNWIEGSWLKSWLK